MRRGAILRGIHRSHRLSGNVLALLVATWFASGAVMVFSGYPRYTDAERVDHAAPLSENLQLQLPPALRLWIEAGGLADGARARLSMLENAPVWTFSDRDTPRALSALPPYAAVEPLDAQRAASEAERRFGAQARVVEPLQETDQWTVSRRLKPYFPLFRVELADAEASQVYVSGHSAEIVQASSGLERTLAWLGAIPHWIYPAALVRHREVWRMSVLILAGLGLVLSLSGLAAGIHIAWITRGRPRSASRNPYLRWHQRIGLAFGTFASTWLLSGALSLEPFDWTGDGPSPHDLARIHGPTPLAAAAEPLSAGLARCQRKFPVRELELAALGGQLMLVCQGAGDARAIVDTADPALEPHAMLPLAHMEALARQLAAPLTAAVSIHNDPDDYYYPTHGSPELARPYARIEVADALGSTFYLDPAQARLVHHTTHAKRVARWLYNGLHSLDLAALYRQPTLWRVVMLTAMLSGFILSSLGIWITLARALRRAPRPPLSAPDNARADYPPSSNASS